MKKRFISAVLAITMLTSVTAFAATENSISQMKKVFGDTVLEGGNAPELIISPKGSTSGGDISFKLVLDNAKWVCDESGSITTGVDYTLMGEKTMVVDIDGTEFDLSAEKLSIPLNVEVGELGTASVTVDSKGSTVSDGTYIFAYAPYPETDVTVGKYDAEEGKFTLSFDDDYVGIWTAQKCFEVELSEGFAFESYEKAYGEGKYSGKVKFEVDGEYPEKAEVYLTTPVNGGEGKMIVEGIKVKALDDAKEGKVTLSVKAAYGQSNKAEFDLFEYVPEKAEELPAVKTAVQFKAGEKYYTVNEQKIAMDAAVTIDEHSRVIMPARFLANALGVNDTNIQWITDEKGGKAVIYKDGVTVEARPGEMFIVVDGKHIELDTSAVIIDERIYLPLRGIANALGVADSDISWDDETKTATIMR